MDTIEFYRNLYQTLDRQTPLAFDCGRLCGGSCCHVAPDLPGMYLFPGEEAMFAGKAGFALSTVSLPNHGPVMLLACQGTCDRAERPLSCRVFPLAPRLTGDTLALRLDPRGRAVCPLCNGPRSSLAPGFRAAVEQVFQSLLGNPATSGFVRALSAHLNDFEKIL